MSEALNTKTALQVPDLVISYLGDTPVICSLLCSGSDHSSLALWSTSWKRTCVKLNSKRALNSFPPLNQGVLSLLGGGMEG